MRDAPAPARPPGSIELLGIEPLEEHARRLAALLTVSHAPARQRPHAPRSDFANTRARCARSIRRSPRTPARRAVVAGRRMAARQLPHHRRRPLRDIHHDLPPSFFRRLPRIAADEFAGLPRIYAMALELIRCSAGRLDAQRLHRFITAFQSITPLTMGELWAWPRR